MGMTTWMVQQSLRLQFTNCCKVALFGWTEYAVRLHNGWDVRAMEMGQKKLGARGCVLLMQKTKFIFRAHN